MSYNKEEFERIDNMTLGELVHYLIINYDSRNNASDDNNAHMQSSEYFHAFEELNNFEKRINKLESKTGILE